MIKLIELNIKQEKLLCDIIRWIESNYSKHGYVQLTGRWRMVGEYLEILHKIIVLKQYTPEEQMVLNEARNRYIKGDLGVDDLPF